MLAFMAVLADGVTIKFGDNIFSFDLNFLFYLIIAAIIGFVAEIIVGRRLPLGFVGAIIAALIGVWLLTKVIVITGIGDIILFGLPLIRGLIGTILLVALWNLLVWGFRRRRYG